MSLGRTPYSKNAISHGQRKAPHGHVSDYRHANAPRGRRGKSHGPARYAADVSLPGTLWGKSLHSPYAHARIVRLDTSAARQVPGVHAVITGAEVRAGLWGRMVKDVPVLAYERVRFCGERVAAVADG